MGMSNEYVQPQTLTKTRVPENIFVTSSADDSVTPGKEYRVFRENHKLFIFNKSGRKVPLDLQAVKWQRRDKVVMLVKVITSRLGSLTPGQVYRVYNDARNDERYVIDANNVMVLFDKNIFTWEVL